MKNDEGITARFVAMKVLNHFDVNKGYASDILNRYLGLTEQKQRATDLVFGTIRNQFAIDMIIKTFTGRPVKAIAEKLLTIIRIATYELIYRPNTASHAIVNEAVENIKTIAGDKQIGFVNAALRQITRGIENRDVEIEHADVKKVLPVWIKRGCLFNKEILPSPEKFPDSYLSDVFSLPLWLTKNWIENFGYEQSLKICLASNRNPSVYLRVNTQNTTQKKFEDMLTEAEVIHEAINENIIKLKSSKAVFELPGFSKGLFSVQDVTASKPAKALGAKADEKILDLCSAPGGKTTQLAELTSDKALIIATDIDSDRLRSVLENAERLKLKSIIVTEYGDVKKYAPFDRILADVPCSNTGVLSKRPEARHRLQKDTSVKTAQTQKQILEKALELIRPEGTICYSTCSIAPEENSLLIKDFIAQHQHIKVIQEELTLPSPTMPDCDGGYFAVLKC
ncbi:MAG TPA: transcription antitermination factor NusB [Sedimentisphaerales bacterium]|nr:transcription antitermination factor NusB [Sedimentisphaerales bacterium]